MGEFGCDRHAMQQLLLLSQLEPAGHREANKLIDKMLKMLQVGAAGRVGKGRETQRDGDVVA